MTTPTTSPSHLLHPRRTPLPLFLRPLGRIRRLSSTNPAYPTCTSHANTPRHKAITRASSTPPSQSRLQSALLQHSDMHPDRSLLGISGNHHPRRTPNHPPTCSHHQLPTRRCPLSPSSARCCPGPSPSRHLRTPTHHNAARQRRMSPLPTCSAPSITTCDSPCGRPSTTSSPRLTRNTASTLPTSLGAAATRPKLAKASDEWISWAGEGRSLASRAHARVPTYGFSTSHEFDSSRASLPRPVSTVATPPCYYHHIVSIDTTNRHDRSSFAFHLCSYELVVTPPTLLLRDACILICNYRETREKPALVVPPMFSESEI